MEETQVPTPSEQPLAICALTLTLGVFSLGEDGEASAAQGLSQLHLSVQSAAEVLPHCHLVTSYSDLALLT